MLLGLVAAQQAQQPALQATPTAVLTALSLIQPYILMTLAVLLGLALAPRLGLRSHLVEAADGETATWSDLRRFLPLAVLVGALSLLVIIALEAIFAPLMPPVAGAAQAAASRDLGNTLSGILYGGIVEELMLRWGVMTFLAWVLWRVAQRGVGEPRGWIMWSAIVMAALLFGAGHLSAASLIFEGGLTPVVIIRTVLLNAVAGVFMGWLYWRRSLEAAMISHASFHVALTLASLLGVAARLGR
jgi:hypothetical protein